VDGREKGSISNPFQSEKNKSKPLHRINQNQSATTSSLWYQLAGGSMQIGDRLTVDSAASKIFSGLPQN
jgi:hypothetical protein